MRLIFNEGIACVSSPKESNQQIIVEHQLFIDLVYDNTFIRNAQRVESSVYFEMLDICGQ